MFSFQWDYFFISNSYMYMLSSRNKHDRIKLIRSLFLFIHLFIFIMATN